MDQSTPDLEDFPTLEETAEGSGDRESTQHAVRISRALTRAVQLPEILGVAEADGLPELYDDDSDSDYADDGVGPALKAAVKRTCQAQTRS